MGSPQTPICALDQHTPLSPDCRASVKSHLGNAYPSSLQDSPLDFIEVSLLSLPTEILIMICQHLYIPSLFKLRLAHPFLASLVREHSLSIAPFVASNTFPRAKLLLRVGPHQHAGFTWLQRIVPKFNAAAMVDRLCLRLDTWIPAENEIGNELRGRVRNGWMVLDSLSGMSRAYMRRHNLQVDVDKPVGPKPGWSSLPFTAGATKMKMKRSNEEQRHTLSADFKEYFRAAPQRRLEGFNITLWLLRTFCLHHPSRAFVHSTRFKYTRGSLTQEQKRALDWALIHTGVYPFFLQWSSGLASVKTNKDLAGNTIARHVALLDNANLAKDCIEAVKVVEESLKDRSTDTRCMEMVNSECGKYHAWHHGLHDLSTGEPLARTWMADVPFLVFSGAQRA